MAKSRTDLSRDIDHTSSYDLHRKPGGDTIPTIREVAAFEAGIKLGALYHQFVGSPVSLQTACSLEQAMEDSISLQPHVRRIEVKISRDMIAKNPFGYDELSGKMIYAEIEIEYCGERIVARLEYNPDIDYPLMRLL